MSEHKCHRDGCDSGARWRAYLHLDCAAPGFKHVLGMESTVEVCDKHRDDVRPYVLSPANKETITVSLMDRGYHEPNWLTARIEFRPIEREPIIVAIPCDRDGCANPARWQIKQVISEIGQRKPRVELTTNLCVCEKHKRETAPADLMDDESRKTTYEYLQKNGVMLPDLDRMALEFVPISGAKIAAAMKFSKLR